MTCILADMLQFHFIPLIDLYNLKTHLYSNFSAATRTIRTSYIRRWASIAALAGPYLK